MKSIVTLALLIGQAGWACPNLSGTFVSNTPNPETLTISQTPSNDVVKYHFVIDGKTEFDLVADGQTRKDVTQDYDGTKVETTIAIKCEDQILVRHDTRLATGKWERRITFNEDSTIKLELSATNDLHLKRNYTEKFSGVNENEEVIYSGKKE